MEEFDLDATRAIGQTVETLDSGLGSVSQAESASPRVPAARGQFIGRYSLLSTIGAGAMGVVLAGYDRDLDRKVALKLLAHHLTSSLQARARLRREALALGKLDHPNVVMIYDVGVHGGQIFIAMEFIEGQTVGEWMKSSDKARPWPEVLEVFMAAGRGLAAAHETGLIHRDFKPDNMMMGADGRVRVMDFGLARVEEDGVEADSLMDVRAPVNMLTRPGTQMGTPAYMPLEQLDALGVDARSDQFSFCVALYEALYGERPFAGDNASDLYRSLRAGEIRAAPKHARVPKWLREVVVRGLAQDPDQRWPSMDDLLAALAEDPAPRRRKIAAVLGGVAIIALALVATHLRRSHVHERAAALEAQQRAERCAAAGADVEQVWSEAARAPIERATRADPALAEAWARSEPALAGYARAWADARERLCLEAEVAQTQAPAQLEPALLCLEHRRAFLASFLASLSALDGGPALGRALAQTSRLPAIDACEDPRRLELDFPLPAEARLRDEVRVLRPHIARFQAMDLAGDHAGARAEAEALLSFVSVLGWEPLVAQTRQAMDTLESRD